MLNLTQVGMGVGGSYPCSTLVLGLWPDTDSELSASEGTTAKNLQGINNKMVKIKKQERINKNGSI